MLAAMSFHDDVRLFLRMVFVFPAAAALRVRHACLHDARALGLLAPTVIAFVKSTASKIFRKPITTAKKEEANNHKVAMNGGEALAPAGQEYEPRHQLSPVRGLAFHHHCLAAVPAVPFITTSLPSTTTTTTVDHPHFRPAVARPGRRRPRARPAPLTPNGRVLVAWAMEAMVERHGGWGGGGTDRREKERDHKE
ncbi:hypothetical protein NL676_034234 [Syzygium grande]|nr:hypothetical protein NL676_034234 [Syzygium grande]